MLKAKQVLWPCVVCAGHLLAQGTAQFRLLLTDLHIMDVCCTNQPNRSKKEPRLDDAEEIVCYVTLW